jgi:ribosomal protein S27AE
MIVFGSSFTPTSQNGANTGILDNMLTYVVVIVIIVAIVVVSLAVVSRKKRKSRKTAVPQTTSLSSPTAVSPPFGSTPEPPKQTVSTQTPSVTVQQRFCQNCGRDTSAYAARKFCPICGKPLEPNKQ